MIQNWSSITFDALQGFWQGFIAFIPKLIGAIIVVVVGWFVAVWLGKLIALILKKAKLDTLFEKTKWQEALEKADLKIGISEFIGALIKWVLIIVFLLAGVEILGMDQFAAFLRAIVSWLPNLVVAAAIFVVAVIIAELAAKIIKALAGKMEVKYVNLLGTIVRWSIGVFAALAILSQLGVARDIIQILVTGFVALVVIGGGLALGLGGKDMAKELLESLRNKLR